MKIKKLFAAMAACAVAAVSMTTAALSGVSAAETEIAYTGPSADAFAINDDGSTLRLNIYNEWASAPMSPVLDINNKGSYADTINVTFTIDGLKGGNNVNEDGSAGDPYIAELVGSVGTSQYWGPTDPSKNTVTNDAVSITGNGQYTATFKVAEESDTILCLVLSTNINAYNYAQSGKPADTGISIKVDKITTGGEAVQGNDTQAEEANENNNDANANNNNANANANNNNTAGAQNNNTAGAGQTSGGGNVTSASTGDAGIAIAVAGLAVCGIAAVVTRRKH